MAHLIISLEGVEKTFDIDKPVISIGRDKKNDVSISHDSISRFHAKLEARDDGTFLLRDLQSTNGTKFQNKFIGTTIVRDGDQISFGNVEAKLVIPNSLSQNPAIKTPIEDHQILKDSVSWSEKILLIREALGGIEAKESERGKKLIKYFEEVTSFPDSYGNHSSELPTHKLENILEISKAFCSILDLTSLLNVVIDIAIKFMKAERGFIMLYDESEKRLIPKIARKMLGDIERDNRERVSKSIAHKVFEEGKGILTSNAWEDSRFVNSKSVVDFNIHSVVCVPIKSRGKVFGVLYVDSQKIVVNFGEIDKSFLEALAGQAAIAIENAQLYEKVSVQKKQIEDIVNGMADGVIVVDKNYDIILINPAARETLRYQEGKSNPKLRLILDDIKNTGHDYTQNIILMKPERVILANKVTFLRDTHNNIQGGILALRNISEIKKVERVRSQFLSFLSHNLIGPIEELGDLIFQFIQGKAENVQNIMEKAYSDAEFCKELAGKLLYFSELCAGPLRLSRIYCNFTELIKNALKEFEHPISFKKLKVEEFFPDNPCEIWIDPERVLQAIKNLFLNAILVTPPGETFGYVLNNEDAQVSLEIWDKGEKTEQSDISNMISQDLFIEDIIITNKEKWHRSNIRVAFAKHIMDAHGGTIDFRVEQNSGKNIFILIFRKQAQLSTQ